MANQPLLKTLMGNICLISLSRETSSLTISHWPIFLKNSRGAEKENSTRLLLLDSLDLDYSILYRLAEELHF